MQHEAEAARETMLDAVSLFSDELTEAILEESVTEELIHDAVRKGTLSQELTPVFLGSAYKNKGVQPLLDAVTRYLPSPTEVENTGVDLSNDEAPITLALPIPTSPLVALAFKLEDGRYGQLTYLRVYQGQPGQGHTHREQPHEEAPQGGAARSACTRTEMEEHRPRPTPATSSRCSASTAPPATPSPTSRSRWR